jgi:STE24 endopeptidase
MNKYALIISTAIFLNFLVFLVSNYLNLLNLKKNIPDNVKKLYNPQEYEKSKNYIKQNSKFGLIHELVNISSFFVFWMYSGFAYLDTYVRQFPISTSFRGVIYISIFMFLSFLINLPFNLYHTFIIDNKFGFNRTTAKTFFFDMVKNLLLFLLIGLPLIYFIMFFFEYFGFNAWIYAWIFITCISLVIQYLAPKFIMPLFNKFIPIENNQLKLKIIDYCKKLSFSVSNIFVIDGSKRTSKGNAFFTGYGKNKTIAIYDTLLNSHSDEEIIAILAHEIGHYKKKHVLINIAFFIVHSGIILILLNHFIWEYELYTGFYLYNLSIYAGFIFFFMLYTPIEIIINPLLNFYSRANEYQADKFAVNSTGLYDEMISALKKLAKNNLSNLTPHPLFIILNYSHPTIDKRIRRIEELKKNKD